MDKENRNLKLYSKYRQISMDFLFYYTIDILFLTKIKGLTMSNIVLAESFYSLFVVILQIFISSLVRKIGIKKGMILGNLSNAIFLIILLNANNYMILIVAQVFCALGFCLKDICEPSMLNDSIDAVKEEKSKIFAKVQSKAVSGYFVLSAISVVVSGYIFEINGYLPLIMSLIIIILTFIISFMFKSTDESYNEEAQIEKVKFKEAIKFCFQSRRCKSLLIFSAVFYGIIIVLASYEVSLLDELSVSSAVIGIIFAILNLVSSYASLKQNQIQNKFKNRTLSFLGIMLVLACTFSGVFANLKLGIASVILVCIMYCAKYFSVGLYNVFMIKYLSNFTNEKIDTQIFAVNSFLSSIVSVLLGFLASFIIDKTTVANSMLIFGLFNIVIMILVLIYMKKRVGLDPKEYSEIELKYDKNE